MNTREGGFYVLLINQGQVAEVAIYLPISWQLLDMSISDDCQKLLNKKTLQQDLVYQDKQRATTKE